MSEKLQSLETELVTIRTVTVPETEDNYIPYTPEAVEVRGEVKVKLVKPPRQVGHLHKEILTGNFYFFCFKYFNFPPGQVWRTISIRRTHFYRLARKARPL